MLQALLFTFSLLISFWCYAAISGTKDGIIYARLGAGSFIWDEHKLYTAERLSIGLIFFIAYLCGKNLQFESNRHLGLWLAIFGVCVFTSFSFWHNGFYNLARKGIDKPDMKFMTNTGRYGVTMHFTPSERIVGLIFGVVLLTINTLWTVSFEY